MGNNSFQCNNCGDKHELVMPIDMVEFAKKAEEFTDRHKDCDPVWERPKVPSGLNEQEKLFFWLQHGERGNSSNVMAKQMTGANVYNEKHHPYDIADFNRCEKLLETVPELRDRLDEMRGVSPVWDQLVDNWPELVELLHKVRDGGDGVELNQKIRSYYA